MSGHRHRVRIFLLPARVPPQTSAFPRCAGATANARQTLPCLQRVKRIAQPAYSPPSFSRTAHGAQLSQQTLLVRVFLDSYWRRFFPGIMSCRSGPFRARLGSLAPRRTTSMANVQPRARGPVAMASTARITLRPSQSFVPRAFTVLAEHPPLLLAELAKSAEAKV